MKKKKDIARGFPCMFCHGKNKESLWYISESEKKTADITYICASVPTYLYWSVLSIMHNKGVFFFFLFFSLDLFFKMNYPLNSCAVNTESVAPTH